MTKPVSSQDGTGFVVSEHQHVIGAETPMTRARGPDQ
jgi:hypothetical protein